MDERTMWEDLGREKPKHVCNVDNDVHCVDIKCPPGNMYNYNRLKNKPSINGKTLEGDLTSEDLGLEISDKNYLHIQKEASTEWVILHNLNKYPSVSVMDSAGEEVIGSVHYDSTNQVTITFVGAFKGSATLN